MTHYVHVLSVSRLQVAAHIGFYAGERAKPQPVEVCFRLYFPQAPAPTRDDTEEFFDYGVLCQLLQDFVAGAEFNLIEFMASELFRQLRAYLDTNSGKDIKLWLRLNKIAAPVPNLAGGAAFTVCDLPEGATVASCE